MSEAQSIAEQFLSLPVEAIQESATNPRQRFDQAKLSELADSVKEFGVLQPIIVRPVNSHYEIIAGARRFRAARLAGLPEIPVRIRTMTDEQVLEVQVIENLQREDVHPIEETAGYQRLIEKYGYTPATLAERVNRSESYIHKRLALSKLTKAGQDLFMEGKLELGHALLLCRLEAKDQAQCLKDLISEETKWNRQTGKDEKIGVVIGSVSELKLRIEQEILLDLSNTPWSKDDASLVKKAGACTVCPKRTGSNLALFDDTTKKGDHCLDRACFHQKMNACLARTEQKYKAEHKQLLKVWERYGAPPGVLSSHQYVDIYAGKKPALCDHAEKALVVEGHQKGFVIDVCRSGECKIHWPPSSSGRGREAGAPQKTFAEIWTDRKKKLEEKIDLQCRRALFRQLAERSQKEISLEGLQNILERLADRAGHDGCQAICEALAIDVPKPKIENYSGRNYKGAVIGYAKSFDRARIQGFLLALCQATNLTGWRDAIKGLRTAAKAAGIDAEAIEHGIADQLREDFAKRKAKAQASRDKQAKAAKKKGKAKAAKPAAKVRACRVCGCTEDDCSQCVEKTGEPCSWVEKDLCSACVPA